MKDEPQYEMQTKEDIVAEHVQFLNTREILAKLEAGILTHDEFA